MRSNQKGITLVALTITVIVLLILAGISLRILLGNDGLLSKTRRAKEEAAKASVIEDVQLSWGLAETKYQTRTGEDNSKEKSEYFTRENISDNLNDGTVPDESGCFVYNETGVSKVIYENKNKERYIVEINSNGEARVVENSDIHEKDAFVSTNHSITLNQGGTYQITSSNELKWNSTNSNIASITTEGSKVVISGVAEGNTVITGKNANDTTVVECNIKVSSSSIGTFKWKKYNVNVTSVYEILSPVSGTAFFYKNNCIFHISNGLNFCKSNGLFKASRYASINGRELLMNTRIANYHGIVILPPNGFSSELVCTTDTSSTRCWSDSVFLIGGGGTYPVNTSSTFSPGSIRVWHIKCSLGYSRYSKGSDTGTYVTSSNPLDYPSNGYKNVDGKNYWFEMVVE